MSLQLPAHDSDLVPAHVEFEGVKSVRSTRFRVERVTLGGANMGALDGVEPGGHIEWEATAAVKSSGTVHMFDVGQTIDWLRDRLKIIMIITNDFSEPRDYSLGVFLPSAPVSEWSGEQRSWKVELLDMLSILDTDVVGSIENGPFTFSVVKGQNAITRVKAVISQTGESTAAIPDDDGAVLTQDMAWDIDATRLEIVNGLLDAAGYRSLWCDGDGNYRVSRKRRFRDVPPQYRVLEPFVKGDNTLMVPDWSHDSDTYSIPNRVLVQNTSTGDDEGESLFVENDDLSSEYSFTNRGRWITESFTNVEVAGDDEDLSPNEIRTRLYEWGQHKLESLMGVASEATITHVPLPEIRENSTVDFGPHGDSVRARVMRTRIPLDGTSMSETVLRAAGDATFSRKDRDE